MKLNEIKNVTIAGGGTLGSQVAWQTAFHGYTVTVFDPFAKSLDLCRKRHDGFGRHFMRKRGATEEEVSAALQRLSYTSDLEEAFASADFVNESVPENIEIKQAFYKDISSIAPKRTIFTTNSSTLIPSQLVAAVDRPDKFLALHFANGIWEANVGEVMGHPHTDPQVFNLVVEFARSIGMVPIPINKEQNGYVLNSLLVPFIQAAENLWYKDIADAHTIDKTWMIATGMKKGPFAIMDIIGMETIYNVHLLSAKQNPKLLEKAEYLKKNFIDKGKLGISTGEGFYTYPNPAYEAEDFLT